MDSECPRIFETCQLEIPCYQKALQEIGANQGKSVFVYLSVFHNNPICQTAKVRERNLCTKAQTIEARPKNLTNKTLEPLTPDLCGPREGCSECWLDLAVGFGTLIG